MHTYAILRRSGWRSPEDVQEAAARPEAIREHAGRAFLPCDEIIPVADTVVVNEDPVAAAS